MFNVKGACPTVVNVKNSRTHRVQGRRGEIQSVKSQKRVEGCSVSILHGCSTHQGSCCKAKNGELGGSEEPKSTKIVDSVEPVEVNGALRLHTKINVKVQELNVK